MSRIVKASILFRTSTQRAFDTFANPEHMKRFWFDRRDSGLRGGTSVLWYLGPNVDADSFLVSVVEYDPPSRLVIEWGENHDRTTVTWTFEGKGPDSTLVRIEESGHLNEGDALVDRLLDSTGGFNQVLVAAKAYAEHEVAVNVVSDHAQ